MCCLPSSPARGLSTGKSNAHFSAPHIHELSVVHGAVIRQIGFGSDTPQTRGRGKFGIRAESAAEVSWPDDAAVVPVDDGWLTH